MNRTWTPFVLIAIFLSTYAGSCFIPQRPQPWSCVEGGPVPGEPEDKLVGELARGVGDYIVTATPEGESRQGVSSLLFAFPGVEEVIERGYSLGPDARRRFDRSRSPRHQVLDQVIREAPDVKLYYEVKASEGAIKSILSMGRVLRVEALQTYSIPKPVTGESTPSSFSRSWGTDRSNQRDLPLDGDHDTRAGYGEGVDIYIIDTGCAPDHPDYRERVEDSWHYDATVPGGSDAKMYDPVGHGTHVTGTALGASFGIASKATGHCVKVLGPDGSGTTATVVEGINEAVLHATENDLLAVINLSLGGPESPTLADAICRAIASGIVVVVAAGNDSADYCCCDPARVIEAVTAGASTSKDNRAWFSNHGCTVDAYAPGVGIDSAWPGGGEKRLDGTSMASPHMAGAAAVLLGIGIDAEDVHQALIDMATPDKISNPGDTENLLLYIGE